MSSRATSDRTMTDLDVPRSRSALPLVSEPMTPWLVAAFAIAALNLAIVVSGHQLPVLEQALLLIGLCTTLATGGLVAARSNRGLDASDREERARPAAEELVDPARQVGAVSYVVGMERWTTAVLELVDHALARSDLDPGARAELTAASSDTQELRDLLAAGTTEDLTINDTAMIHAVCTLWEANQARIEHLAARADASWHRRWRARTVADRRLRHGSTVPQPLVLPYRA